MSLSQSPLFYHTQFDVMFSQIEGTNIEITKVTSLPHVKAPENQAEHSILKYFIFFPAAVNNKRYNSSG